jgi:hypothetical protein
MSFSLRYDPDQLQAFFSSRYTCTRRKCDESKKPHSEKNTEAKEENRIEWCESQKGKITSQTLSVFRGEAESTHNTQPKQQKKSFPFSIRSLGSVEARSVLRRFSDSVEKFLLVFASLKCSKVSRK